MMGRTHSVHAEPTTFGPQARRLGVRGRPRADAAGRGRRRDRHRQDLRPGRDVQPPRPRDRGGGPGRARPARRPGQHPDRPARPARRAADRRSPSWAGRWSASRPRSATSSTPRSARSRSRSRPARRARARCPTSATRSCPSGSPAWPGCCAATRTTALEDQPLWHERDISHSAAERVILPGRDDPARLHAGPDDRPRRGAGRPLGADAREHRARPRAARQQPGPGRARRGRRARRARRPTRSSSAPRCGPPTSARRCATCWRVDPAVAQQLSLTQLDACFDERGVPAPRPRGHRPARPPRSADATEAARADG